MMPSRVRRAAIVATAFLLAACGGSPVSQATTMPATESPEVITGSPTSATPTPVPVVATAAWVAPADGFRLEATTLALAATVSPPAGVSVGRVSFVATSAGGEVPVCTASAASVRGQWGCKADLMASGVSVGPVSFALIVTGGDGAAIATTAGSRDITYAVLPPKPADPTYTLVSETPNADGTSTQEYRITWTSPKGLASRFLVYGVTECLRYSKANDTQPCVTRGTKIPKATQVLLAEVPGDARSTTLKLDVGELGFNGYWAIVIRATNDFGDSIFTIVDSGNVCYECVY